MTPFNEDGNAFIRSSARSLQAQHQEIDITPPSPRRRKLRNPNSDGSAEAIPPPRLQAPVILTRPKTFAHYILNLPASALTFLPSFIGLYAGCEHLFTPQTDTKLPMVHVYCFGSKSNASSEEEKKICDDIGRYLDCEMQPAEEEEEPGEGVQIWDVRDVAPLKTMFCASFRLPSAVAFRAV